MVNIKNPWIHIVGFALASLALYETGFLFFIFLVPVQLLHEKYGFQAYITGAVFVLLAIGIVGLLRTSSLVGQREIRRFLLTLEFAFPIFFFLGLGTINWEWKKPVRGLYRLLAAAVVCGAVSIPFFLLLSGNEGVRDFTEKQFALIAEMLRTMITGAGAGAETVLNTETLITAVMETLLRNYLFITFMIIALNWHFGRILASRFYGRFSNNETAEVLTTKKVLLNFSVPPLFIWPFIASWAGILLDSLFDLKFFGYIVWNAGLILLFVYGLQGIGIIRYLFDKYRSPGGLRLLFGIVVIILLFWPGLNLVIMIGIPGLGISEIWIHYRNKEKEQ